MQAGPTVLVFGFPGFFIKIMNQICPQVLFTADLKLFSSYNLKPPPSPSPLSDSPTPVLGLQTPPVTPSVSPLKRKWDPELGDHVEISPADISELCLDAADSLNLADRVKKRKRF